MYWQEVFVNIWRKIQSYDSNKGRLFTWMLNIARNLAIDVLRSKSLRRTAGKTRNWSDSAFAEKAGAPCSPGWII